MNFTEVKELFSLFEASSLRELSIKMDNVDFYMNKNQQAVQTVGQTSTEKQPIVSQENVRTDHLEAEPSVAKPDVEPVGKIVTSPIVGVVYLSKSPGEKSFKEMGDTVNTGETLCIIEAMKLMNEITSDTDGKVVEILVENEQIVEYGQPLFRIA